MSVLRALRCLRHSSRVPAWRVQEIQPAGAAAAVALSWVQPWSKRTVHKRSLATHSRRGEWAPSDEGQFRKKKLTDAQRHAELAGGKGVAAEAEVSSRTKK